MVVVDTPQVARQVVVVLKARLAVVLRHLLHVENATFVMVVENATVAMVLIVFQTYLVRVHMTRVLTVSLMVLVAIVVVVGTINYTPC